MPNKTFRLYPKAINDLEDIYLYSVREFGLQRTEDYILAIETSFQYLANDPLISRKCDYILIIIDWILVKFIAPRSLVLCACRQIIGLVSRRVILSPIVH